MQVFMGIHSGSVGCSWDDEVDFFIKISKVGSWKAKLKVMVWTEMLCYVIWYYGNKGIFGDERKSETFVSRDILFRVSCRANEECFSFLVRFGLVMVQLPIAYEEWLLRNPLLVRMLLLRCLFVGLSWYLFVCGLLLAFFFVLCCYLCSSTLSCYKKTVRLIHLFI